MVKKVFLLLLVASSLYAGEDWKKFPIGPYGTLNNRDNSYTIPSNKAQDLLNVNITQEGKSVVKRKGFAQAFALTQTTSPVHGIYNFFDSNGNDVSLFFNDSKIFASVSGLTPVQLSTSSNGSTFQCTDSLGFAYCTNSTRTSLYKITGSTLTTIPNVASTGTMVTTAVTRLVQAGFQDRPSGIDFSAETDFSTWGTGSLGRSACQFTINAPGSKITHITYAFNRLMWFKDSSFGYILTGVQPAQSDWVINTVAYDVGTNDNTSVYREGILYFRGQDGHIYAFDGYSYQRLSREISGTINSAQSKIANSWLQTSQADYSAGLTNPQGFISSNVVSGSLMGSSFTVTETNLADFQAGTMSNVYVSNNSLVLSTDTENITDNGFEGSSWTGSALWSEALPPSTDGCVLSARTGTKIGLANPSSTGYRVGVDVLDGNSGAILFSGSSVSYADNSCTWAARTITGNATYSRKYVKLRYTESSAGFTMVSPTFLYNGRDITYYTASDVKAGSPSRYKMIFDDITGGASLSTGVYTSKSYDTGISTNFTSLSVIGTTINTFIPDLTLQTSNDGTNWRGLGSTLSSTNTLVGNRYLRYISSFTVTGSSDGLSSLDNVTIVARATGTYLSTVKNAASLSAWDSFQATSQNDGGNISFFVRSSTGVFFSSATAPGWTPITPGSIPSISTNPYFQMASSFSITCATQNPTINDFTFNWFEGAASDKSYATYFDDKVWWSLTVGTSATANNRILAYDLLNQGWLIYDIPSNGFYTRQNKLYFGSSNGGYIYKYGDVDNDAGSAINSYWKSKDFFGDDPFTGQELANISLFAKSVSNSTMTVTYTLNGSSSTSFNFPLYSSQSSVGKNKNLPAGIPGGNFSVQFGNNAADQPWELFAIQLGLRPKTWTPTP